MYIFLTYDFPGSAYENDGDLVEKTLEELKSKLGFSDTIDGERLPNTTFVKEVESITEFALQSLKYKIDLMVLSNGLNFTRCVLIASPYAVFDL